MVLGKLPVPGRPTVWMLIVGQGPIALAVGVGGGFKIFLLSTILSLIFSLSLWGTAQYRLKYYLKGPLNQKQTKQTNKYNKTVIDFCFGEY